MPQPESSALTTRFRNTGIPLIALPGGGAVPVAFSDPRTEHVATRNACGLFDFSFMGGWEISGAGARAHLTRLQTRDVGKLAPGQIAYTLMCRDDGSIFNDATIWMLSPERYWLFSGRQSDAHWVAGEHAPDDVSIREILGATAVLALQGPNSGRLLATFFGDEFVRELAYFRFAGITWSGEPCHIARLGYSGELGYELVVPAARAPALWQALLDAGAPHGLRECGFDAANSLRVESGYILFSAELAHPRRPAEVRLERLLTSRSANTRGLAAPGNASAQTTLACLELVEENAGNPVVSGVDITSRVFSPTAGKTLALGFTMATHCLSGMLLRAQDGVLWTVCGLPHYDPAHLRPKSAPLAP